MSAFWYAYAEKTPTSELPWLWKAMSSPFPAAFKQGLEEHVLRTLREVWMSQYLVLSHIQS